MDQSIPAIEQLYSDILKEKRRRLESNFDASPDYQTVCYSPTPVITWKVGATEATPASGTLQAHTAATAAKAQ